ncbi:HNH endonuclease [Dillenia turbinata]|uniref:HNH endonuclease n=1 Tax=Dillenia turbinata TaxID=194707 RepID=A0AAN8V4Q7_9MAGN
MEITEEQRKRAEANRLAALAKRKAILEANSANRQNSWKLFKCTKVFSEPTTDTKIFNSSSLPLPNPNSQIALPEKFRVKLEICSPDSFSITPEPLRGFGYPGQDECFDRLYCCLSNVLPTHFTQLNGGGKASVYKLMDYDAVVRSLKNFKGIEVQEIPWGTLNVVEKVSRSFVMGRWMPCRPEHLSDEDVDGLIAKIPTELLYALHPFQLEGVKFGLRRGGRCLIGDEMGLGKTIQAIAIASCFMDEGSILVVCPAVLRYSWAEELERWLPLILPTDIHLVFGHENNPAYLTRSPKVVVISYTMLKHLQKSMIEREWALLIIDESHHLRSSKRFSEPGETKAVLDIAAKIKRIVLLSGTPSLSRPGLLGRSKYEFAKTYCAVNYQHTSEGKTFQDFSKGTRLEELNVLLKQTVMIRRLKAHVLDQLPPKRRQIVILSLSKSDVHSAKSAVCMEKSNETENHVTDDKSSETFDIPETSATDNQLFSTFDDSEDCTATSKALKQLDYQEVGIAKLAGFFNWLSINPIIGKLDDPDCSNLDQNDHKMIIFAHHHKVLDRVQEFLSEKGIEFVRIDGTMLARDKQSAVKIALVGIKAGGVGLNFSSAQNVVFLELPPSPALMLQAEDRAHRQGQTKAVNIYIFLAKDTRDEFHWKFLNKSLLRVSSTTDGKYDSVQKIEVESVSDLDAVEKSDRSIRSSTLENGSCELSLTQQTEFPSVGLSQDMPLAEACEEAEESVSIPRQERAKDSFHPRGSEQNASENEIRSLGEDDKLFPETTEKGHAGLDVSNEVDVSNSIHLPGLRFEVSQYTGRIHLYSCISGCDSRPRPLFENFRPEDLDLLNPPTADDSKKENTKFIKDNPAYKHVLMAFVREWNYLRPIEKRKLFGKPLQLPLSVELCCLNESINHDNAGLLRGKSKRRKTPLDDISRPLPSGAVWRRVRLCSGYHKKEKEYTQGWILQDEPLCKLCQSPCKNINAKTPEFFEDLFCKLDCYEEYRLRTSNRCLRKELFQIEHGICSNCQLDCHKLVKHLRPLSTSGRHDYILRVAPKIASKKKLLEKLVQDPTEGNAWHADHIVPVYLGGGECRLENMRTLCVACHADVTAAQGAQRRSIRVKAKKQLKAVMSSLKNARETEQTNDKLKKEELMKEDIVDNDLLIEVPGSAYTGGENGSSGSKDLLEEEKHPP